MQRVLLAVAALVGTVGTTLVAPAEHERPATAWIPDKAHLGQLAPEVKMPGFRIRPPNGYAAWHQGPSTVWLGPVREDGTRPYLTVLLLTPAPGGTEQYTSGQALETLLAGVQRRHQDWQRDATERGWVNGREFVRVRWSGVEPPSRRKMHGFSYVAVIGGTIVHITSRDVEPHQLAALNLAETAALTFRRP